MNLLPSRPGVVEGGVIAGTHIAAHPQVVQMLSPAQKDVRLPGQVDVQGQVALVLLHKVKEEEKPVSVPLLRLKAQALFRGDGQPLHRPVHLRRLPEGEGGVLHPLSDGVRPGRLGKHSLGLEQPRPGRQVLQLGDGAGIVPLRPRAFPPRR